MVPAERLTFRPFEDADFATMAEWCARPHVARWWADPPPTAAELRDEYRSDIAAGVVAPFIVCLDGAPVGFIQVYDVMNAGGGWWLDETDPGARGVDQFLADEARLGKGLGTRVMRAFLDRLFADPVMSISKVQANPSPHNARAIRAYEKSGFRRIGEVTTPEGPAVLMVIRRQDWHRDWHRD